MNLKEYFNATNGLGVLATSSSSGAVDAALYARPRVLDDGSIAFIMADRLSHANLASNPHAAYLFRESSNGHAGMRLYLTKVREESDPVRIETLRRRDIPADCLPREGESRFLVTFRVDRVRSITDEK